MRFTNEFAAFPPPVLNAPPPVPIKTAGMTTSFPLPLVGPVMKKDKRFTTVMCPLLGPPNAQSVSVGAQIGTTTTRGLTLGPLGHEPSHVQLDVSAQLPLIVFVVASQRALSSQRYTV